MEKEGTSTGEVRPMHRLLSLRRGIWERLQAAIAERIEPPSPELRRYEQAYRAEFQAPVEPIETEAVLDRATRADIVYCGDFHSFPPAQRPRGV